MAGESKPPCPPFTEETARIKVKAAQNAWNTRCSPLVASTYFINKLVSLTRRLRNPAQVKMAYTPDSIWRNRDQFFQGRDAIEKFLTDKWSKENGYRLRKELFAFSEDKVLKNFHLNFIQSTLSNEMA